ncbi:MAG: fibronectin type III domain-containing protein [Verrucomicrobia bacterium]|nr:fibronectin type III domain-containing protein [Verrucomicrobiota bacterium]
MASNTLPDKRDRLFALGDDMCDAAHDHEVAIGLKQNTESVLRPALDAARGAEANFGQCQILRKVANAALTTADSAAKVFISRAKKRLSIFLGESYTTEWGAAGWPNNSVATPSTQDDRFNLVNSLKLYLTTNPTQESVDMSVTAALATACHTNLSNARTALDMKVTEVGQAKQARDNAEANLRVRMKGLITELATVLSADDPLWHAFGLSRPADEETPEPPTFTTALASVAGTVLVDWDDALRAERYRVWIMIVGVDTDFRAVETVYDSDVTLAGLTSGATVKIRVTSANDAGESLPGPVAEVVVP